MASEPATNMARRGFGRVARRGRRGFVGGATVFRGRTSFTAKVNKGFPSRFSAAPLLLLSRNGRPNGVSRAGSVWRLVMARLISRYAADESGASAIEYGLIVSLISVAILGTLTTLGINLRDKAMEIAEAIGSAGS